MACKVRGRPRVGEVEEAVRVVVVAAWGTAVMFKGTGFEVLGPSVSVPLNSAVMECVPTPSEAEEKVACQARIVPVPSTAEPSRKLTGPLPAAGLTSAEKRIFVPCGAVFADRTSDVAVPG